MPIFADYSIQHWIGLIITGIVIYLLPHIFPDEFFLLLLQTIGYTYMAVLGLDFLVGYTGQTSLGHQGFFAIGGYTTALMTTKLGFSFWLGLPVAILFSGVAGLIMAVTAFRAKGPYIAMITIAFGFVIQVIADRWMSLTNGPTGIFGLSKPTWFGNPVDSIGYFYIIGYFALGMTVITMNLLCSRIGRTLKALRENEIAAESLGINVYAWKTIAFVISGIFAGIGGVFFAHQSGFICSESFQFGQAVMFLAAALLGGSGKVFGPLVGTVLIVLLPIVFAGLYKYYLLLYGLVLLLTIIFLKNGIIGSLVRIKGFTWLEPSLPRITAEKENITFNILLQPNQPLLTVRGLCRYFGGVKALDGIDYDLQPGHIYGLIGPNGSGKTTLINVLSGVYPPSAGTFIFQGERIKKLRSHTIAAKGIARTFQAVRLFHQMSLLENLMVGFHIHLENGFWGHMFRTRKTVEEEKYYMNRSLAILRRLGLEERAYEDVRNLAYGHQRLGEIGRALGVSPAILFLDEPAAGMNPHEIQSLKDNILDIKAAGIPCIVVVEHHMDLVMAVSDSITVLDFGEKIAEGTPAEVQENSKVCAAYLGAERIKTDVQNNQPDC